MQHPVPRAPGGAALAGGFPTQTATGTHLQHNASSTHITDGSVISNAIILIGFCRSLTDLVVLGSALMCVQVGAPRLAESSSGMVAAVDALLADPQWVNGARAWLDDPSRQRAAQAFLNACRDAVHVDMPADCLSDPEWLMLFQSAFEVHPTLRQDADTFLRTVGMAAAPTSPETPRTTKTPAKPARPEPGARPANGDPRDVPLALMVIGGAMQASDWWQIGVFLGNLVCSEQQRRALVAFRAWHDLAARLLASAPLRKAARAFMRRCVAVAPFPAGSLQIALETPAWWGMVSNALATDPRFEAIAHDVLRIAGTMTSASWPGPPPAGFSPPAGSTPPAGSAPPTPAGSPGASAAPEDLPAPAYEYPADDLELERGGWATGLISRRLASVEGASTVPITVLPPKSYRPPGKRWATLPRSGVAAAYKKLHERRTRALVRVALGILSIRLEQRGASWEAFRAHPGLAKAVAQLAVDLARRLPGAAQSEHLDAILERCGVVPKGRGLREERKRAVVMLAFGIMASRLQQVGLTAMHRHPAFAEAAGKIAVALERGATGAALREQVETIMQRYGLAPRVPTPAGISTARLPMAARPWRSGVTATARAAEAALRSGENGELAAGYPFVMTLDELPIVEPRREGCAEMGRPDRAEGAAGACHCGAAAAMQAPARTRVLGIAGGPVRSACVPLCPGCAAMTAPRPGSLARDAAQERRGAHGRGRVGASGRAGGVRLPLH